MFLWIISRLFYKGLKAFYFHAAREDKESVYNDDSFLLLGLLSGLLVFLMHSFVDTSLYSLQLNTLLWYTLALTVCLIKGIGVIRA
jgi:hypothetical protein